MTPRPAAAVLLTVAGLLVAPVVAIGTAAGAGAPLEVNLHAVGHIDLGGGGPWDDIAAVGTTAVVSSAPAGCAPAAVTVVDVKDAAHPRVAARLPVPEGLAVAGLAATAVTTPTFRGDLLAVAVRTCRPGATGAGLRLYDVGDPAAPVPLGRTGGNDPRSVSVAVRADGQVLAAVVIAGAGASGHSVEVDDLTDPARPLPLARWTRTAVGAPLCAGATADAELTDAELTDGGRQAVVAFGDGDVYDMRLDDPTHPAVTGLSAPPPGGSRDAHATSLPVGRRTLAIVSEGRGSGDDCGGAAPGPGVRLLAVDPPASIAELNGVTYPGPAAPGRLVASGELAFVAWHADGLRVLDVGQVRPRTVAQFVPAASGPPASGPDVVGVAVLGGYLVVTDAGSGLYVLQRPDEGTRESLWSRIKGAAGFMSIPLLLGAVWAVPRLAMGAQPVTSRSPVPVPAGRRRRRA